MQEYEILKHIRKYQSSGVIHDALIPLFDQDGRWRGDQIRRQTDELRVSLQGMRKAFLRSSRRIRKCRSGTVLRTSFYRQGAEPVRMPYCGIDGSLIVSGNAIIHAANLRDIGGHVISDTNEQIYLPNLRTVGGRFELIRSFLIKAPRLRHVGNNLLLAGYVPPCLETVGGRLSVHWSFTFHAPRLKHVGGCLVPHKCTELIVPMLETVGGGLLLNHAATRIEAPMLRSVGGDFLAGTVGEIRARLLRSVSGDIDTRSAKQFYHPDIRVGGEWNYSPEAFEDWLRRKRVRLVLKGEPFYL
jgi:hypothetical protein